MVTLYSVTELRYWCQQKLAINFCLTCEKFRRMCWIASLRSLLRSIFFPCLRLSARGPFDLSFCAVSSTSGMCIGGRLVNSSDSSSPSVGLFRFSWLDEAFRLEGWASTAAPGVVYSISFVSSDLSIFERNVDSYPEWLFRLCKTSWWHWFESCVLRYTKTQLSHRCQRKVLHNLNVHPVQDFSWRSDMST